MPTRGGGGTTSFLKQGQWSTTLAYTKVKAAHATAQQTKTAVEMPNFFAWVRVSGAGGGAGAVVGPGAWVVAGVGALVSVVAGIVVVAVVVVVSVCVSVASAEARETVSTATARRHNHICRYIFSKAILVSFVTKKNNESKYFEDAHPVESAVCNQTFESLNRLVLVTGLMLQRCRTHSSRSGVHTTFLGTQPSW